MRPSAIATSFRVVSASSAYRSYLAMLAISYCGIFAFLSASSHVLQEVFALSSVQFGLTFALCSFSYIAGNAIGTRLVSILRLEGMLTLGVATMLAAGLLQIVGYAVFPRAYLAMIIPQMIYFLGTAFLVPQIIAAALTPFPERAGAASSLMGFVQMISAALVGALLGTMLNHTAWPLIVTMTIAAALVFWIFFASKRVRSEARADARSVHPS